MNSQRTVQRSRSLSVATRFITSGLVLPNDDATVVARSFPIHCGCAQSFGKEALAPACLQPRSGVPPVVPTNLSASVLAPVHVLAQLPMQIHRNNLVDGSKACGSDTAHLIQGSYSNVITSAVLSLVQLVRGWMGAKADALKLVGTKGVALVQQSGEWVSAKADAMNRVATEVVADTHAAQPRLPNPPNRISNAKIIEIKNLKKSYGLKPVLRGIDLELCQGERMALLGANGAGKTTLLRTLAGLTKPDAGVVSVAGLDCVRDAQHVRQLVGFVGHQPYLYEELTALENLLFFGRMYMVKHTQERARELLQRVGLEKRMQERVSTLSRGQVQRLAWARALLHSPRLLLLDEPDTGLDQAGCELIDALLLEHNMQGGSIVFTTHQLERVLQLSDRVVVLGNRRVAYQEATKSLELTELQRVYREVAR